MIPYCRNNSNYTFREICCAPKNNCEEPCKEDNCKHDNFCPYCNCKHGCNFIPPKPEPPNCNFCNPCPKPPKEKCENGFFFSFWKNCN